MTGIKEELIKKFEQILKPKGRNRPKNPIKGVEEVSELEGLLKGTEKWPKGLIASTGLLSSYLPISITPVSNPKEIELLEIKPYYNIINIIDLEKILKNNIISLKEKKEYNIMPIIIQNFNSIKASPSGFSLSVRDTVSITADNIGEFALPIVEYIHQTQPDYVVASDRGARLLGLAVFKLYGQLYGRFPTVDGTLRFRRFSKSNSQEATEEHLRPLVNEMLQHRNKLSVLVLDDWVASGGTKRLAKDVFDRLGEGKIEVRFGVLIGKGADISGHNSDMPGFAGVTDWRDDSNIIGVSYGNNHLGYSGIRAQPVRSKQARYYRRRMYDGVNKLAGKLVKH